MCEQQSPVYLYKLKELAIEHLNAKRYSQAAVYFKDILNRFEAAIRPVTSEYEMEKLIREIKISSHKNLSLCYLKLKKYTECFEECRHVLDIDPNCVKIIYRVGKAYMSLGNYQEAETYLLRGFMLDPHENEIMRALEEIQERKNGIKSKGQANNGDMKSWLLSKLVFLVFLPVIILKYLFKSMGLMKPDKEDKHSKPS